MRIVIAAPPKSGNSWVKCLLASIYDLAWLRGDEAPANSNPATFIAWAGQGNFPDDAIFHQHYDYSEALADTAAAVPAHLVTIIRDPYDAIVSLFFFVQAQATVERNRTLPEQRSASAIIGKAIDDPDTIDFLDRRLGSLLAKATAWVASGRSVVVRYEALHRDPMAELIRATAAIAPVAPERITRAITACEATTMRQAIPGLRKRIRTATVGDWRQHLTDAHLSRFRVTHGEQIHALGYEVYDVVGCGS